MSVTSPNRRLRRLVLQVALVVSLAWPLASPAAASDEATIFRVRSTDSAINGFIELASARSVTFRRLLALIQGSDGIVYVEPGQCGHGTRACLKVWMQAAGSNRFLRVVVDRRRAESDEDFMGTIGHELQHTVEALSERSTSSGVGLYNFFSRAAQISGTRFETTAAIKAGDAVRVEAQRNRGTRYLPQRAD
jgi:hypothetical protein